MSLRVLLSFRSAEAQTSPSDRTLARPGAGWQGGRAGVASALVLALALIQALWPLWASAAETPAQRDLQVTSDCNDPAPARVLRSLAHPVAQPIASAHWLDTDHLQWPAGPRGDLADGSRVRLYLAEHGGLLIQPGQAVRGHSAWRELRPAVTWPETLQQRFPHLGLTGRWMLQERDGRQDGPEALQADTRWLRGELALVHEDALGRVLSATGLQIPGVLDARFADAAEQKGLGLQFERLPSGRSHGVAAVRFGLWAPTAQAVQLCLYPGPEASASRVLPMTWQPESGIWQQRLVQDLRGQYYRYLVDVFVPGLGLVRNRVTDPYAVSFNADSRRSYIADLDDPALMPAGWATHRRPAPPAAAPDMSIYELHVRDFSVSDPSQPPALRGKYGAFTQGRSLGMQHLKRLAKAGLTDVHLLPVFDIASIPERGCKRDPQVPAGAPPEVLQAAIKAQAGEDCFNWGYDPLHYSAPEGSYSSEANDGARRLIEFRQMVMALHGLGMRVGMDVVYNHTPASGQHPHSVLDRIVPGYYQRLDAQGRVERSTCCDNTATEHRMMARLMSDSVLLWAQHHGIDAFRFDLMGHQPREVMVAMQKRLRETLGREIAFIGEGWNFGEVANGARFVQASQLSLNGTGIGTFSDRARDALRGGSPGDGSREGLLRQGWSNGLFTAPNGLVAGTRAELQRAADLVRVGLAGSLREVQMQTHDGTVRRLADIAYGDQPAGYVSQPGEVVNYAENHDNHTLFDSHALRLPRDVSPDERVRAQLLALAVTAYSQGVPYFHAGGEILRSKSLDRNSYDSGDAFNRLDWTLRHNGFDRHLPPAADNQAAWPVYRPLLSDERLHMGPAQIRQARDAFLDLLKVRASTPLMRLANQAEVLQRLRFHLTGPEAPPQLLVLSLDGTGLPACATAPMPKGCAKTVLLVFNGDRTEQSLQLPMLQTPGWRLHPVLSAPEAGDQTLRKGLQLQTREGRLRIPAWSAAVLLND